MLIYEENFSSLSFNSLMNFDSASREITSYLCSPKEIVEISGYEGKTNIGKMAIYESNIFGDRKGTMRI